MTAPDEFDLVDDLLHGGCRVGSVYDLVNTASPYPHAYSVLARHLNVPHSRPIREGIVRALTVKDARPVAGKALLAAFQVEQEPLIKWVLANAVRTVLPWSERQKHPAIAHVLASGLAS